MGTWNWASCWVWRYHKCLRQKSPGKKGYQELNFAEWDTGKWFPHRRLLSGRIIVFAVHISSPHLILKSKCTAYELQQMSGCTRDLKFLPLSPFRKVSEKWSYWYTEYTVFSSSWYSWGYCQCLLGDISFPPECSSVEVFVRNWECPFPFPVSAVLWGLAQAGQECVL